MIDINKLHNKWESEFWPIIKQYQGVMLACSGGIDSTALFYLFYDFIKRKKNFYLGLIHVNYKLRGKESDLNQFFIENLSEKYCIPLKKFLVTEKEQKLRQGRSLQEWARLIRYDYFYKISKKGFLIALGHHKDDIAENVILRLARGSSIGALAGMRSFSPPYLRPLLELSKNDLALYLKTRGITYSKDSSNDKIYYSRNKIRHIILPELEKLYPGVNNRISACALEAQQYADYIEDVFRIKLENFNKNGGVPLNFLINLPNGLAFIFLSLMVNSAGKRHQLSRNILNDILSRIKNKFLSQKNWSLDLPGDLKIICKDSFLWVRKAQNGGKKSIRELQHRTNLKNKIFKAVLSPQSEIEIFFGDKIFKQKNNYILNENFNKSTIIEIRSD